MIAQWHGNFVGLTLMQLVAVSAIGLIIAAVVIILKGMSLWCAARRGEKVWFIALLIVNTLGILELIYLIFVVKKSQKSVADSSSTPLAPVK